MRNIIKRDSGRYQVNFYYQKRRYTKSFTNFDMAKVWLKETKAKLQLNQFVSTPKNYPLFSEVIERYKLQAKRKRGYEVYEKYILESLKKEFSNLPINKITTSILAEYRDRKLETVKEATVKRHFNIIRHIFNTAINEWEINFENPFTNRKLKLKDSPDRERRITDSELNLLLRGNKTPYRMRLIIELAIETSLRRQEILGIQRENIKGNELYIPPHNDKLGLGKTIPLSSRAISILEEAELPFYNNNKHSFNSAWQRLVKTYNIKNLQFRDTRHEAISRFFEDKRLNVPEVQLCSGHKNPRILLKVYTNLNRKKVAEKLS